MIKVKRILAALLAAICLVSLISCSSKIQGVERPSGKTALKLAHGSTDFEMDVTDDEYDYYYLNFLAEGIGADAASEKTEAELRRIGAIYSLAKEHGVALDSDDRKAVKAEVEAAIEQVGGEDKFNEGLAEFNMTKELYLSLSQMNALETVLREYVIDEVSGVIKADDKTVEEDVRQNFFAAKQILISNDKGDDVDSNRELANDIYARLSEGADFDAMVSEYGEDKSMDAGFGRYFTDGMFPEAFEDAVAGLEIGEMSGVIESEVGFHIALRMPIDEGYLDENFNTLRYYYLNRCFNELVAERSGELELTNKN